MSLFDDSIKSISSTAKYEHTAHFPGTSDNKLATCKSCEYFENGKNKAVFALSGRSS